MIWLYEFSNPESCGFQAHKIDGTSHKAWHLAGGCEADEAARFGWEGGQCQCVCVKGEVLQSVDDWMIEMRMIVDDWDVHRFFLLWCHVMPWMKDSNLKASQHLTFLWRSSLPSHRWVTRPVLWMSSKMHVLWMCHVLRIFGWLRVQGQRLRVI